jgi:glutamate/tyrosine decarboxylase-like PLP-dependent enzyme
VHVYDALTDDLAQRIFSYALERIRLDPPPLDGPRSPEDLRALVGRTITAQGIGGQRALELFAQVLAPSNISVDHPRFWAFVAAAPTEAATLFDLVVGASSLYGGSWLEGAGSTYAENQALRWLADLAGLPDEAGGVFVSGGTAGNLSALVAARHAWRGKNPANARARGAIAASSSVHSSVRTAARVMDVDVIDVPADGRGRLTGSALGVALADVDVDDLIAIVATAGSTNVGVVDDLAGAAAVATEVDTWLHVDGAYGGAALMAPKLRRLFDGIERADSFIVDPHKWLFAPYDCCALLYRDPRLARAAHAQKAEYLDVLHEAGEWNPSDYAIHLTRRARGMPLWFSLATYGTDAYREAIEMTLSLTQEVAHLVDRLDHVELCLRPELSVIVLRRVGWQPVDYQRWCDRTLRDQIAFVVPSSWKNETVLRLCFVNPRTTIDDVAQVLETLQ